MFQYYVAKSWGPKFQRCRIIIKTAKFWCLTSLCVIYCINTLESILHQSIIYCFIVRICVLMCSPRVTATTKKACACVGCVYIDWHEHCSNYWHNVHKRLPTLLYFKAKSLVTDGLCSWLINTRGFIKTCEIQNFVNYLCS